MQTLLKSFSCFKYTKTSITTEKTGREREKKEQARDTINRWESEWWDTYGNASQSDFTAGCLYPHEHLHICLHFPLQKRDRCVRSQYMHKHTAFIHKSHWYACLCIPGNPACLLIIWLVVLCMNLCYHSRYICPVVSKNNAAVRIDILDQISVEHRLE